MRKLCLLLRPVKNAQGENWIRSRCVFRGRCGGGAKRMREFASKALANSIFHAKTHFLSLRPVKRAMWKVDQKSMGFFNSEFGIGATAYSSLKIRDGHTIIICKIESFIVMNKKHVRLLCEVLINPCNSPVDFKLKVMSCSMFAHTRRHPRLASLIWNPWYLRLRHSPA